MTLDRGSPVPLYHQLEASFLRLIRERGLAAGDQFPGENELVRQYNVTRPTVRRAMERLVQRGVLYRQRGRGTFVGNPREARVAARVSSIKILLPSLTSIIHLQTIAGAVQEARENGFELVLGHSDTNAVLEAEQIAAVARSHVAALLLWPVGGATDTSLVAQLQRAHVPCVLLDRYLTEIDTDYVVVDDSDGAYAATSHLAKLGHRRISFLLYEDVDVSSVRLRLEGYRQALSDHEIPFDNQLLFHHPILPDPRSLGLMDDLSRRMLTLPNPPTAAFCVNDHLAQGLLIVLRRQGIAVPQQFSVAGFDGLEYIPYHQQLTTVRRATAEMGSEAVRLVVRRLSGDLEGPPRHLVLPTELIVGETSAPPHTATA